MKWETLVSPVAIPGCTTPGSPLPLYNYICALAAKVIGIPKQMIKHAPKTILYSGLIRESGDDVSDKSTLEQSKEIT